MTYRFQFDPDLKRRLLAALAILAFLLFLAGLLGGALWSRRSALAASDTPRPTPRVAAAQAPAPRPAPAAEPATYLVLLSPGRLERHEAENDLRALAERGYPAEITEIADASGRTIHTVRLGPYATAGAAASAAAALQTNLDLAGLRPTVRRVPPP